MEWDPWWSEDLMDEKGSMWPKAKGNKGEGSWWIYLLFSFCECVWLFVVGNDVEGICGVHCMSNVQDHEWANFLAMCVWWSFGNGGIDKRINGAIQRGGA